VAGLGSANSSILAWAHRTTGALQAVADTSAGESFRSVSQSAGKRDNFSLPRPTSEDRQRPRG